MSNDGLNAVVGERIEVASGLIILRIRADGWNPPAFLPGQFAVLGLGPDAPRCPQADTESTPPTTQGALIRRAYSLSSPATAPNGPLEFYINLVRSGALSPRLFALEPGDRLWLGPRICGLFTLERILPERGLLLLATGTGLAPYMSMIRTRLMDERQRPVTVIHAARHSWDLGYRGELSALARTCGHFSYRPVISRPDEEQIPWQGLTGHLQDCWQSGQLTDDNGRQPTPDDTTLLLCGHPDMITAVAALARHDGWNDEDILFEEYWR